MNRIFRAILVFSMFAAVAEVVRDHDARRRTVRDRAEFEARELGRVRDRSGLVWRRT